jgi:hypothetical protein
LVETFILRRGFDWIFFIKCLGPERTYHNHLMIHQFKFQSIWMNFDHNRRPPLSLLLLLNFTALFHRHNLLFYPKHYFMGQRMVSSYSMISLMVLFTLMTPYNYHMGHHSPSFVTKNGKKLLTNIFCATCTSITSYSANNIFLWANGVQLF